MKTIKDFCAAYYKKIDLLDLELIISRVLHRPREFVLAHPEYKIPATGNLQLTTFIKRRIGGEPLAYILGRKEFYGLDFKVNKNVLVPRPETEALVELAISNFKSVTSKGKNNIIVDVGTGSGNIIISLARELQKSGLQIANYKLLATDISGKVLQVAKKNAKKYKVDRKIRFLKGNLLEPIIKKCSMLHVPYNMIITANLPYLSPALWKASQISVQMYEPKKALISLNSGLCHYNELFGQIKKLPAFCSMLHVTCYMEISPEQRPSLQKLIKKNFLKSKIKFHKDLANKWRVCEIKV
jgi:release factor glutamine methyltransferase